MRTRRLGATLLVALTGIAAIACLSAPDVAEDRTVGKLARLGIAQLLADRREDEASRQILALAGQQVDEWTVAWAQREFAHLAVLNGTVEERRREWRARYEATPGDPFCLGLMAQLLFASEQPEAAIEIIGAHVARERNAESAWRLAAATYECFGTYDRALEVFAELLRIAPHSPEYLAAPDGWMAVVENRQAAWHAVGAKLAAGGANPFLHSLAGDYARELRDYPSAVRHYRDAVAKDGGAYAKLRLAEALKAVAEWDQAAALHRQVATADDVPISASHRSRSEATRRLGELEAGAKADYVNGVWIRLGKRIVGNGLELVERQDSVTAVEDVGGRECRRTDGVRGGYFLRFRVNDRFLFEASQPVVLEFHYFDEASGQGKCTVSYDSTDPTGSWMPVRNGRDKEPACFYRQNSRQWKTATFRLPDARFGNRLDDYTDFRIRSFGDNRTGGDLCVSEVRLRLEGEVEARQEARPPARTREVPIADLPNVKLSPYNVQDCRAEPVTVGGEPCLRFDYYLPHLPVGDYAWTELVVDQPLAAPPRSVGVRMDPRGSLCEAALRVVDATGETFQMKITYQMHGYGWTVASRPLTFLGASWGGNADSKIDYPATLHSLLIDTSRRGRDSVLLKDLVIQE